jgi:hypothetical protein
MTHSNHKKFKNESQDARRRDKHNATHPEEKFGNHEDKLDKEAHLKSHKRK